MGWFDDSIRWVARSAAERTVRDYFAPGGEGVSAIERIVWETIDKQLRRDVELTATGFIWALRLCFHKHGSSYAEASDLANSTLRQFLADEKIKYGHRDYAWTRDAADQVADEYELQHWEQVA